MRMLTDWLGSLLRQLCMLWDYVDLRVCTVDIFETLYTGVEIDICFPGLVGYESALRFEPAPPVLRGRRRPWWYHLVWCSSNSCWYYCPTIKLRWWCYHRLLAYRPCFFYWITWLKRVTVKFIRDQESYSNHTASHTTNHTAMTPPERIAVQQSYNLLTAISLGGVRP